MTTSTRNGRILGGSLIGAVLLTTAAAGPGSAPRGGTPLPQVQILEEPQPDKPDPNSPNWKLLSEDVGLWMWRSEHSGIRHGRLYLRKDDAWVPIAVDGVADLGHVVPIGK